MHWWHRSSHGNSWARFLLWWEGEGVRFCGFPSWICSSLTVQSQLMKPAAPALPFSSSSGGRAPRRWLCVPSLAGTPGFSLSAQAVMGSQLTKAPQDLWHHLVSLCLQLLCSCTALRCSLCQDCWAQQCTVGSSGGVPLRPHSLPLLVSTSLQGY